MSKLNTKKHINIEIQTDELDLTKAEAKGAYDNIKDYISEEYGAKVSSLNIVKVKEKLGIQERDNHNFTKNKIISDQTARKKKKK